MKYAEFVVQPTFFSYLFEIDQNLAITAKEKGCPGCGEKLDVADFWRSGHGMPDGIDDKCCKRLSFCCRNCRKRMTPDSVRFLRGIAYTMITLVIFSAIHQGLTSGRANILTQALSVSRQTIARWIKWWRDRFIQTPFWQEMKARFMPPLSEDQLAFDLIKIFMESHSPPRDALVNLLKFLAPWRGE